MKYLDKATEMAFRDVPETCPILAEILYSLAEAQGIDSETIEYTRILITRLITMRLRDALIEAHRQNLLSQAELRKMEKLVKPAEPKIVPAGTVMVDFGGKLLPYEDAIKLDENYKGKGVGKIIKQEAKIV